MAIVQAGQHQRVGITVDPGLRPDQLQFFRLIHGAAQGEQHVIARVPLNLRDHRGRRRG
jgi:hypothetical protein